MVRIGPRFMGQCAHSRAGTGGSPVSPAGVGYSLEKTVFPGHVLPAEARCEESFEVECKVLKMNQRPNALQPPRPRPCPPGGFICRHGWFPESMQVCLSSVFTRGFGRALVPGPASWVGTGALSRGTEGGWVVSRDPAGGREQARCPGAHAPQLPWAQPGPVHGKAF